MNPSVKETKKRKQTWKGSDSQRRVPGGSWAVGQCGSAGWELSPEPKTGECPPVHREERAGRLHLGADAAEPGWSSTERRAAETDGGAGGSSPGRETTQGCLSECWGQCQARVFRFCQPSPDTAAPNPINSPSPLSGCNRPVCYFFSCHFRLPSTSEHCQENHLRYSTIALGTIHGKERPRGRLSSLRPRSF